MASNKTRTDRDAYISLYDKYSKIYGDPVETTFAMMANGMVEPGVRRAAAADLMSYRFPKTKAIDIQATLDAAAGFSFAMVPNVAAAKVIEGEVLDANAREDILNITHDKDSIPDDYISAHDEFSRADLLG